MDIQPQNSKPISDDQELAKVLAGITGQPGNVGFEETPAQSDMPMPDIPANDPTPAVEPQMPTPAPITGSGDLESIKKDALLELRPLVDKLDIAAEEKFDIYLLLLRSTDDKTLIAPAHKAAQDIADESKKAQALLDIIKEIDFLSTPQ